MYANSVLKISYWDKWGVLMGIGLESVFGLELGLGFWLRDVFR